MSTIPYITREQVIAVIDELISGAKTRDEVAKWANETYTNDTLSYDDKIADALEKLGAVDLVTTDRPFLYTLVDFKSWRKLLLK